MNVTFRIFFHLLARDMSLSFEEFRNNANTKALYKSTKSSEE